MGAHWVKLLRMTSCFFIFALLSLVPIAIDVAAAFLLRSTSMILR